MKTKSRAQLKVTTGIKAGGLATWNHARRLLKVKTNIRAGGGLYQGNHSARQLSAR